MRRSATAPFDQPAPAPRRNNTKSCQRCRDKRIKCDGKMPSEERPGGAVCSSCTSASHDCTWDLKPDRRLAVSRHDYEQLGVRIKIQNRQIAALQERLRVNGLSDDLPDNIEEDDDGYGSALGNQSDADDELAHGFGQLVLEEDNIMYYGDPSPFADFASPMTMKPRLPAIEGFQHSTSRMYEISPMHALGGPGRESNSTKWDMYLPHEADGSLLITRDQHDRALDLFFRFFTSWTLRVIPHFFLRDLVIATEAPDPKPQINHYGPMLHNIIMAIALAFSDEVALRERSLRDKFVAQGKTSLDAECQKPTLSTVQSLDLLSSYYSGMGDQTLGFMYFGMAIRMGQALGLHVRIPDGKIGNDDRIERNWVYWNVFIHDKTWSLYVGRNQALPSTQVEMRDPPIDFRMDFEQWYWRAPDGRVITQQAYLSSTFAEVVKLSCIASEIMAAVYDKHLAYKLSWKLAQINGIWINLRNWRQCLRKELAIENAATAMNPAHVFQLNLVYEWMTLLLLRPFHEPHAHKLAMAATDGMTTRRSLSRNTGDLKGIYRLANEECPKSASRILDLFQTYDKLFTLRLTPLTNVHIAYHAGKTLMRIVISGGYGGTKATQAGLKARDKVRECAKQLRAIGETWPTGVVTAEMLEKDLEAEIGRQSVAPQLSPLSPKNGTAPTPPAPIAATRIATSPRDVPIVSPRSVSCDSTPESPNKKRRNSPETTGPSAKRTTRRARFDESHLHNPHPPQAPYPVSPISEQQYSQISSMPTMDSNFGGFLAMENSSILSAGPSTSSQAYFAPPPYPPPYPAPISRPSSRGLPTVNNRLQVPVDPLTGFQVPTSMDQWLHSGNTFSNAPSFDTPFLPDPILPFAVEAEFDESGAEV